MGMRMGMRLGMRMMTGGKRLDREKTHRRSGLADAAGKKMGKKKLHSDWQHSSEKQ
jgi:hypothetical protein